MVRAAVGDHVELGANEGDSDGATLLLLARLVIGEVHVLGGRSLHRVVGHSDAALAVAEQVDEAHANWVRPRPRSVMYFSHFLA